MKLRSQMTTLLSAVLLGSICWAAQGYGHSRAWIAIAQTSSENPPAAQKTQSAPNASSRLTIQVTAGEKNEPVDSASVYVKYIQEHKLRKDKRFEMNVKTNRDGIAHVPEPPKGKILIQIIAPGWKPFGKWFEIEDLSQPIQIHLEKAVQHWY
jgi:hypothetical protein